MHMLTGCVHFAWVVVAIFPYPSIIMVRSVSSHLTAYREHCIIYLHPQTHNLHVFFNSLDGAYRSSRAIEAIQQVYQLAYQRDNDSVHAVAAAAHMHEYVPLGDWDIDGSLH